MATDEELPVCSMQEADKAQDAQNPKVRAETDLIYSHGDLWNSRVALVEKRKRSEELNKKFKASDNYVEKAHVVLEELRMSSKSLTAECELVAAAQLQVKDSAKFHDEISACVNGLNAGRERSEAPDKNLPVASKAMAADQELSVCSNWDADETRKNQADAKIGKVRAEADLIQIRGDLWKFRGALVACAFSWIFRARLFPP